MSRYYLRPGFIRSQRDGDRHWVGVGQLLDLYRVPRSANYVVEGPGVRPMPDDIICQPLYSGKYPAFA